MADAFIRLSKADRREALEVAASASTRPIHLLEKDVWVVWALSVLFEAEYGKQLVFKGGTSLSKVHGAIRRFSEDIDLTYDIRALIPDLVGERDDALPPNPSQEKKWTKEIRGRLPAWIAETVIPTLQGALDDADLDFAIHQEGEKVHIEYDTAGTGTGYVSPTVMLEFGARSTGEPCDVHTVICDAAPYLAQLVFPTADPRVMHAERTFWEKATAIHVFCVGGNLRTDRFSRHWHDLVCLDRTGFAERAISDHALAEDVANHKNMFFREKDSENNKIDYMEAISGSLRLVPGDKYLEDLKTDYAKMVEDGLLLDEAEPFENLLAACGDIEHRANQMNKK